MTHRSPFSVVGVAFICFCVVLFSGGTDVQRDTMCENNDQLFGRGPARKYFIKPEKNDMGILYHKNLIERERSQVK